MSNKQELVTRPESSPSEMIRFAIEKNADLDKLEKLMALEREYKKDKAREAYHKAMSDFKANPPKIDKDRRVDYKTDRGRVGYSHASLGNVCEKINQTLSGNGLSASWTTKQENGLIAVTCRITHVMGHYEETTLQAEPDKSGSKNSIQAIGSAITYLERYTLLALTGLATYDQDDDGQMSEAAVEYIDDKQVHSIRDELITIDPDNPGKLEKSLCDYLGVESLEKLPKNEIAKVRIVIDKRKKKKNGGKKNGDS